MHSRDGTTWKGIILRRRGKIKQLSLTVEVSKAYSIGKNIEQYHKENEVLKRAEAILETTLSHNRRETLANNKKSLTRSRSKKRIPRVIFKIIILL